MPTVINTFNASSPLANTGATVLPYVLIGLLLVVLAIAALLWARHSRRQQAEQASRSFRRHTLTRQAPPPLMQPMLQAEQLLLMRTLIQVNPPWKRLLIPLMEMIRQPSRHVPKAEIGRQVAPISDTLESCMKELAQLPYQKT